MTTTPTETTKSIFGEVISCYTRKQALEDGFQVDANIGDFAEVSRQHFKFPVYMTRGVFDTIEKAVNNPRWCNDFKGVWHDILWMLRHGKSLNQSTNSFTVIIQGAGQKKNYQMIAQVGAMDFDDPRPCVTIMFPDEM